jgi:di/tricarboxylate transporter
LSLVPALPPAFAQGAIVLLLLGLIAVFALDRFRIELVALTGLAAGVALGLVPASEVFSGFADPAVITVAEILLIIQALARSRIIDRLTPRLIGSVRGDRMAIALLCCVAGSLSVFMNNIGALALALPIALSLSARLGIPLARMLMPLSFATLLGGLCSLTGTPANLVISQARAGAAGQPFAFFDFAYAGIPVAAIGILFIVAWTPRRFRAWRPDAARDSGIAQRHLVTEIRLLPSSPFAGRALSAIEADIGGTVFSVIREGKRVFGRPDERDARAGDILVVEIPAAQLEALRGSGAIAVGEDNSDNGNGVTADVVLMPESIFIGSRVGMLDPLTSRGIRVAAVAPQRRRVEGRLADVQLGIGDILVLKGPDGAMNEVLDEVDLLRLSPRDATLPEANAFIVVALFALGVLVCALRLLPPEVAFGLVVLLLGTTGAFRLREALQKLNWPILVMLAAMIPLGGAVEATGAARILSEALLSLVPPDNPVAAVGAVLFAAVALTPFINNVSTAVILSPIAIAVAQSSALPVEPFLIAVAIGASLDFLTPFGHHNNTLVMGIAGYRFIDFSRLGGPLLGLTFAVALFAIWLFWL